MQLSYSRTSKIKDTLGPTREYVLFSEVSKRITTMGIATFGTLQSVFMRGCPFLRGSCPFSEVPLHSFSVTLLQRLCIVYPCTGNEWIHWGHPPCGAKSHMDLMLTSRVSVQVKGSKHWRLYPLLDQQELQRERLSNWTKVRHGVY